jgi:MFS family permease
MLPTLKALFVPSCLRQASATLFATFFLTIGLGIFLGVFTQATAVYNWSGAYFGFVMMSAGSGCLLASLFYPKYVHKFGGVSPKILALLLMILMAIPYFGQASQVVWAVCYGLVGVVYTILFLLAEIHLIHIAKPNERARILTLYYTFCIVGFLIGPAIVSLYELKPISFISGLIFYGLCTFFFKGVQQNYEDIEEPTFKQMGQFIVKARYTWVVAFLAGVAGESVCSFIGVFGIKSGLEDSLAILLISIFLAGGVLFQYPISVVLDQSNKRTFSILLILVTFFVGGLVLAALPEGTTAIVVSIVFWGGACFGLAIMGLALVGDRFHGTDRVMGIALNALFYNLGDIIGPAVIGPAMDYMGAAGLVYSFNAFLVMALVVGLWRKPDEIFTPAMYRVWGSRIPVKPGKKRKTKPYTYSDWEL